MINFNIFHDELNKKKEKNLCDDICLLMTSMYKNIMKKYLLVKIYAGEVFTLWQDA